MAARTSRPASGEATTRPARRTTDEAVNVVVLCSDGVANVGDTMPGSIVDTIAEEGAAGIHLVTVGFGMGNYNNHLMEQLADRGHGFHSHVDTYDEAERLFGTELTTTLVPVAAGGQLVARGNSLTRYPLTGPLYIPYLHAKRFTNVETL